MTLERAIKILGSRAKWELQNMKRTLSTLSLLNSDEEDERLDAVSFALSHQKEFFAACHLR